MEQLRKNFTLSERYPYQLMGLAISTYRYEPKKTDTVVRELLTALACEKLRYYYRWLDSLLRREGING